MTATSSVILGLVIYHPACAAEFKISFKWCGSTPEFNLNNVPKGTIRLDLSMVDVDVPSFNHGGAVVPFKGQKQIECGSFVSQNWIHPDPPSGSHLYRWTVVAQDKNGQSLATTTAERKFPE